MTKDKKKISSNDLKLWYQIVDKVEPIKKRDNPDIKNQEQSGIDAARIISRDVNQKKIIKKKNQQRQSCNQTSTQQSSH